MEVPVERRMRIHNSSSCLHLDSRVDILSKTIVLRLWHITDLIFQHMDAISLLYCEKVCELWRDYLLCQRVWQKAVLGYAKRHPVHMEQVGWTRLLATADLMVYKHTYWKMTNLNQNWRKGSRSARETKRTFHRSGSIAWKFLSNGRAVSTYNSGQGFTVKIHENLSFKFRALKHNSTGTLKNDILCMDATEKLIVVAGHNAKKVWVFTIEEEVNNSHGVVGDFITRITRPAAYHRSLRVKLTKFIASNDGISRLSLHSDERRLAVLKPGVLEIWDLVEVAQEHRFSVAHDTDYLEWKKELLISAPLYTGLIQVFDTLSYREEKCIEGGFRKIDSIALYENLVATAESQSIRLWEVSSSSLVVEWTASKTYISALYMNDTMLVTGSGAGLVKLWDLAGLLATPPNLIPLRRISMKGILYYPIKRLCQCSYTDIVIVAKYEGKRKKDKVKVVEVKWN